MDIMTATTKEYLHIVSNSQADDRQMAIKSANTKEYLHIVSNSQADGSKDGHKVSHYKGILTYSFQ
jgi:hypothetical protein